jgi:hypothetical protein
VQGNVCVRGEAVIRFEYGHDRSWLRTDGTAVRAVAGPNVVVLDGDVAHEAQDDICVAEFTVREGDTGGIARCSSGKAVRRRGTSGGDADPAEPTIENSWRRWGDRARH